MAIYLMCSTSGGLPVFTRKKGDCDNLPFSTIASLNGVHMFCKSQQINLISTYTDDWILVWKDYDNILTIIIAGKAITENDLKFLVKFVYSSFMLFININDFKSQKNYECMKREAKNYLPIIDKLLDNYDTDILKYTDCILTSENHNMLMKLNDFSDQICSLFCSIVINEKLAIGTEGWWDLDYIDRKLLIMLLNSSNTKQIDIPIYLPKRNTNTAYRFVTIPLYGTITVCTICGAEPSYHNINQIAHQIWKNDTEIFQKVERCITRNFPTTLEFDTNILGILMINKYQKKYVISRNLQQSVTGKRSMSGSHRLDVLRSFYYQSVEGEGNNFKKKSKMKLKLGNSKENENNDEDDNNEKANDNDYDDDHAIESYWCSEYHKCHSYLDDDGNLLCILYNASVPSYAMRQVTFETLKSIISDRSTCW